VNVPGLLEFLRRRWWMIVLTVGLCLGAAGAYAARQAHVYQSTASVYVHPSRAALRQETPAVISSELGVLSYGSLMNTLLTIAQSDSALRTAAQRAGLPAAELRRYTSIATVRPKSFVIDMAVDGPDRARARALARSLSLTVVRLVETEFPILAMSPVGDASPSTQIRPRVERDLVYGALAGLLVGLVLAAFAFPPRPGLPQDPEPGPGPRAETPSDELLVEPAVPVGPTT
jgi:capsular polysaccharide biosynthesis protein